MKLIKAHVTNFRSVLDTGEFSLTGTTCLVGKNESGKTTLLQAMERLNPYDPKRAKFNRDLDYPRGLLAEYEERHDGQPARVIRTVWALDSTDVATLERELGAGCLRDTEVIIDKGYDEADARSWQVHVDEQQVVRNLLDSAGLEEEERQAVAASTVDGLASALKLLEAPTEGAKKLLAKLAAFPELSADKRAVALLEPLLPKFLYFSSYDRMDGRVHLETLLAAKTAGKLKAGEQIFLDFLEYAKTSVADLNGSKTFEQLTARVEAASLAISKQIFAYWSQNRNLKVEFSLEAGRPGDEPPFNSGWVMHTRIRNRIHDMTVPFDDRSAGFTWFFSFLVKFSQVQKNHGNVVILLDEPGLNLHAKAQADLLRYIKEKLEPRHQVVYTTHSPFMVPTADIMSVRTVEDVVRLHGPDEEMEVLGTKVGDEVLSTDRDTLFPLQGALGYELSQSLFVGEHTLLLEGPSDVLYLQHMSNALKAAGRKHLDPKWTLCPAGGVDKVWAFVSLFGGNKLHVAALVDYASGQKSNIEKLRRSGLLKAGHVLLATEFCGKEEADIEDLFGDELFLAIVNKAYDIPKKNALTVATLPAGPGRGQRVVQRVEAAMKLLPDVAEFDHFQQASWLAQHPSEIKLSDHATALDNFEKVFETVNGLLSA